MGYKIGEIQRRCPECYEFEVGVRSEGGGEGIEGVKREWAGGKGMNRIKGEHNKCQ